MVSQEKALLKVKLNLILVGFWVCICICTYINIKLTTTVNTNSWLKVGRAGKQILLKCVIKPAFLYRLFEAVMILPTYDTIFQTSNIEL